MSEVGEKEEGTCELVIYCHKCQNKWQLNPEMIALSLMTNASVWDVYNFILTAPCKFGCKENARSM